MRDYTRNIFFCFRQKSRESTKTTRTKISLQKKKKTKKNNKETKRFVERKTRGKKREREDINRVRSLTERKKMQRYLRQKLKKNSRASFNVIMKGYTVGADKGRVGRCQ